MTTDPVAAIGRQARRRYAQWNEVVWQGLVDGPATRLAHGLPASAHGEAVLRSWLQLAAEGVGLGLLSLADPAPNLASHLFVHVVPAQLPGLPPGSHLAALAQAWNLGEALEAEPAWKRALFLRLGGDVSLGALPAFVDDLQRRALDAPAERLGRDVSVQWVNLGAVDARFLPGAVHFVSPAVCCVHDRQGSDDGEVVAQVVWLAATPVALGSTGCAEAALAPGRSPALERAAVRADRRVDEVLAAAGNDHRGALCLATSQFLVALLPA